MHSLFSDLKFGARLLKRSPGFTAVAVATLALGIAANTVIFTAIESFVLRPLPLKEPDRLVFINQYSTKSGDSMRSTWPDYLDWKTATAASFDSLTALQIDTFNLSGTNRPRRVRASRVTSEFFQVMGLPPELGRTFTREDDQPGAAPVVVLSEPFWTAQFGADRGVVGRTMNIDGRPHTIAGVMPAALHFPGDFSEFWVPLAAAPGQFKRGDHSFAIVGRLRDGAQIGPLQSRLTAVAAQLGSAFPDTNKDIGVKVTPLHEQMSRGPKRALMALFAAVSFVLMICCANIANLLMARAMHRQREMVIRLAVGAGRWQLLCQLLAESLLLAALGGLFGCLIAAWGVNLLSNALPGALRPMGGLTMDTQVLQFSAGLSVVTCFLFGLLPAVRLVRSSSIDALHGSARAGTVPSHTRTASALVIGEIALASLLLVGSGLLVDAVRRMQGATDLGFEPRHVLTAEIGLKSARFHEPAQAALLVDQLMARLNTTAGVEAAAAANWPPMTSDTESAFIVEGTRPAGNERLPTAGYRVATPRYAQAMGIRLTRGRFVSGRDTASTELVAVVNERFARMQWPGHDPLGRRVALSTGPGRFGPWMTVVGVVGDVRHLGPANEPEPELFVPFAQHPQSDLYLAVRTAGDPVAFARSLEAIVKSADPDLPLNLVRPMERVIGDRIAATRIATTMLTIFSVTALLLAAIGLYGVMSYLVARRTHEFGVRLAVGATARDLLRLVLRRALTLTAAGTLIGVLAGAGVSRVLRSVFEAVHPEPLVFAAVAAMLGGIAIIATWLPLRRALAIGPLSALREE